MLPTDSWLLPRIAECCDSVAKLLRLRLTDRCVLTECATGAYCSTAVLAAIAGAQVYAYGRDSRFGTFSSAREQTAFVADFLGVSQRIHYIDNILPDVLKRADIITNSGHLRPLDRAKVEQLRPGTVIALMYESWEFRENDVDLAACREQGVQVVGTNEHHHDLRIFEYLGMLALRGLFACQVPVMFCRVLLLSDNLFAEPIAAILRATGAEVEILDSPRSNRTSVEPLNQQLFHIAHWDAVVVAMTPRDDPVVGHAPGAVFRPAHLGGTRCVVQVWGDVERNSLTGVQMFPAEEPPKGHMGVLLNEIGPDAVVRLQAGGLRAAGECLFGESPRQGLNFSQRVV